MPLGEHLHKAGTIDDVQLSAARRRATDTGQGLDVTLVELGFVDEEQVALALADLAGCPFVRLSEVEIDRELVRAIPSRLLHQKRILPLVGKNGTVRVATADPLDLTPLEDVKFLLGREVEPVVATRGEIHETVRKLFGVGADNIDELMGAKDDDLVVTGEEDESGALEMAQDHALIQFVNQIIVEAVKDHASDVHIEPFEHQLRVRYRIDGVLHETKTHREARRFQAAIVSRIKIMAGLNIAEKRLPQDGRIRMKVQGRDIDVRVSVIPTLTGEDVVLRLLDQSSVKPGLVDLGMEPDTLRTFERIISQPNGIFLVTGPTGSGKTTSLYAALSAINTPDRKIITLEDPVEYRLEGINQIQVHTASGFTFALGLRSILRHDPDCILVGEIRDLETAETAIRASLTGHFVFSTLHTNDAPSAVTRLIDMGVEPFLVSSSVEGLMAQRLVRIVCQACKRQESIAPHHAASLQLPPELTSQWVGAGCEACRGTGYKGRAGVFELIPFDEELKGYIVARRQAGEIRQMARGKGMRTLREDGWKKIARGRTTLGEVLRVTKAESVAEAEIDLPRRPGGK